MNRFQHNHKPDAIITAARIGPTTAWVRTFRERKRLAQQIADQLTCYDVNWITFHDSTEIHFDRYVITIRDFETTPDVNFC